MTLNHIAIYSIHGATRYNIIEHNDTVVRIIIILLILLLYFNPTYTYTHI